MSTAPARQDAALIDTSVVLASLDPDEAHHPACDQLLAQGGHLLYVHGLAETFSILTGGRHGRRLRPAAAAGLIKDSVLPFVQLVSLNGREVMAALETADARGVRGGAVYDLLHLAAARKAGASRLLTLDRRDFQALTQPGDPRIDSP
ncbi:MAG: PIN domain-containing protein [Burkholderiales bacterium]|nr:PIN domain-containing protein [Burkholderiales bacterium]